MSSSDTGIVLVLVIGGFLSMVSSVAAGYTCTGGTFNPEDFDTDKCLEWPKKGGGSGGGSGGGGGSSNTDPNSYAPADEYAFCKGQFFNEATTTCFSNSTGIAGIRWKWLESDDATTCRMKTYKYAVVVSSSQNSHRVKYRFPDVIGNDANSFCFSGAPSGFLPNQNIKFYITPLDENDKKIGDTAEYVLDTNNSSEVCNAHGTPVAWSQATVVEDPDAKDPSSEPPPDPVPCDGNVYLPQSACIRAGLELNDANDPQRCGDGFQTTELDTSDPSYSAAQHGGTCNFTNTVPCSFPCAPTVVRTQKTQEDCDIEAYTYNQWVNAAGCVKDTGFDKSSPPTLLEDYTQITESCFPIGEQDGIIATLSMEVSPDGYSCVPVYNWNACGKTECPKDCVGDWVDHPTPEVTCWNSPAAKSAGWGRRSGDAPIVGSGQVAKRQKYVVSSSANSTGACPLLGKERWLKYTDGRKCVKIPNQAGR